MTLPHARGAGRGCGAVPSPTFGFVHPFQDTHRAAQHTSRAAGNAVGRQGKARWEVCVFQWVQLMSRGPHPPFNPPPTPAVLQTPLCRTAGPSPRSWLLHRQGLCEGSRALGLLLPVTGVLDVDIAANALYCWCRAGLVNCGWWEQDSRVLMGTAV